MAFAAEKLSPKIVVIGAGLSGISAAAELYKNGFTNILILEAQDRIGGRIYTQHFGESHIEHGAQWIHGEEGNPLYSLAWESNLIPRDERYRFEDPDQETFFYFQNGEKVDEGIVNDVEALYNGITYDIDRYYRDGVSCDAKSAGEVFFKEFQQYLKNSSEDEAVKRKKRAVFDWYTRHEQADTGCDSIHDASVMCWGMFYECGGQLEVNLSKGYQPILDLILAEIPKDAILLNKAVERINWQQDGNIDKNAVSYPISLKCKDGASFNADHVIVTASAGFLKENAEAMFQPSLPKPKMDAIEGLGFGTVNKLFLEFDKPWWDKHCDGIHFTWLEDEPFQLQCVDNVYAEKNVGKEWYRGILGFNTVTNQPNVLLGWIGGPDSREMETCSEDLVLNVIMEMLKRFTGKQDIPRPVRFLRTMWHSNPYTRGSYSYLRVSGNTTDFAALAEPVPSFQNPQVLFAGEATSNHHFSTTHGAHDSGIRAAHSIIKLYTKDHTHDLPLPVPREYDQRVMAGRHY